MSRPLITGIALSKILEGQTQILGSKMWQKLINASAFLDYWSERAQAAPPKVYACAFNLHYWHL